MSEEEVKEIQNWKCNLIGDAYDEERNKKRAHAKVMKYNLNARINTK